MNKCEGCIDNCNSLHLFNTAYGLVCNKYINKIEREVNF